MRRLLLEVCEREGIPVVLQPPKLADASKWEGALISSTSRLMLPIDELYLPREGEASLQADRTHAPRHAPSTVAPCAHLATPRRAMHHAAPRRTTPCHMPHRCTLMGCVRMLMRGH